MTPNESIGGDDDSTPSPYSPDDLIELVRAVKFAHTDMSTRNVHHEISVTMADSDPSYAFLKDVKLNDVKKVWKKALRGSPETKDSTTSSVANGGATPRPEKNAAAKPQAVAADGTMPPDGIVKFYTVGDGSVKTLAENYSHHHAEAAVAREGRQQHEGGGGTERDGGGYTHFFLDVPADLSGSRPHQALMNYQDNGKAGKARGKSCSRKKSAQQPYDDDDRDIFKIQLAALPLGMEGVPTPMLLYNSDRSAKTFLHPPSSSSDDADDVGYSRIRNMIADSGTSGALGATGGQKAYFYGFITKTKSGDVISVQTTELAPSQAW